MQLFTKPQMEQLLQNGAQAALERNGEAEADLSRMPVVKLFAPVGSATWLISEIDPEYPDIGFGPSHTCKHVLPGNVCDLGMGFPELGSVSISQLEAACIAGLGVERDRHWTPTKSLIDYADEARLANAICA